jgi:hypothetical protein
MELKVAETLYDHCFYCYFLIVQRSDQWRYVELVGVRVWKVLK